MRGCSPTSRRATARCSTGATRCRPRSTPGTSRNRGKPFDDAAYQRLPARDRLPAAASRRRSQVDTANVDPEIATHRRAAARRAGQQRALRAERRQRALGQPVRRALRHRRDPRGRRRRRAAAATTRCAARAVIARARAFLDQRRAARRRQPRRRDRLCAWTAAALVVTLTGGGTTGLAQPGAVRRLSRRRRRARRSCCCAHNGLHVEIAHRPQPSDRPRPIRPASPTWCWKRRSPPSRTARTRVAAVDADDKVAVYRNWLGLMKGTLSDTFEKGGRTDRRAACNPDRVYTAPGGGTADAARPQPDAGAQCRPSHVHRRGARRRRRTRCPKAILDAAVTVADRAARPERRRAAAQQPHRLGLHRQAEDARPGGSRVRRRPVRRASRTCCGLPRNTLKMGIMDEERRTTVNLEACIRAARERVVFINTGFLDRTGDEIHTSMEAGPMMRKNDMKQHRAGSRPTRTRTSMSAWPAACAARRRSARACGRRPTGWRTCWRRRSRHPRAGANTAWVPSPTAATLHALHYHQVDVAARQAELRRAARRAKLRRPPDRAARRPAELVAPRTCSRNSTTTPGHPRLRGALDRPGRRLLEGAGHPRRRR